MHWLDEIALELDRGQQAKQTGNDGKARTAARRAAGIAVTQLQNRVPEKRYGADAMQQLRGIAEDLSLPEDVRQAATRLQARVSPDFTSPSQEPLADARVIIDFIRQALDL